MMYPLQRKQSRRAFTLIEILVVIAIIAILAGLGAWGVVAMIGTQARRNTESTIKVVNNVLQDHWKYVVDEARKDPSISTAVKTMAGTDPTGERAKVLWVKFRLMEAFPQSFADINSPFVYQNDPSGNPYIPAGQRRYIADYQNRLSALNSTLTNAGTQSSACLLIALTVNRGGNSLNQDSIKFAVKDTDSDGIPEIVDGWNRPLMFTRFDSSSLVQAANPAVAGTRNFKFSDPDDPDGILLTQNWYYTTPTAPFTPNPIRLGYETSFQYSIALVPPPPMANARANYVIPSIMSSGKDGVMPSPDDIYSYQLRGN